MGFSTKAVAASERNCKTLNIYLDAPRMYLADLNTKFNVALISDWKH